MLHDLSPRTTLGAAWSQLAATTVVAIPRHHIEDAAQRCRHLGYCDSGFVAVPSTIPTRLRWHGTFYRTDDTFTCMDELGELAPHRREFSISTKEGHVKNIRGYRGEGRDLTRRALPPEDAVLMVNLVMPWARGWLADPFAGACGILAAAQALGWNETYASDIDSALAPGLSRYATRSDICGAQNVTLPSPTTALVTELPFAGLAPSDLRDALHSLTAQMANTSGIAVMSDPSQSDDVSQELASSGFDTITYNLDRKGTPVAITQGARPILERSHDVIS